MVFRFTDCVLDPERRVLMRGDDEIHVEPQVFDLLQMAVAANGAVVSYDDLISGVWKGRIVSDATMAARISAARVAIGDNGRDQRVLRTVPRHGIRLAVSLEPETAQHGAQESPLRQTIRFARSADGTGIGYAESGEGPPLLRGGHWLSHLEHDWDCPVWRPLLDRLGAGRRLVRYDPRGTGLSDRKISAPTVEQFADDMEAVADAAGLERFPVFAASQSAPAALVLAARRPERVTRLILWGGFAQGSTARGGEENTDLMVSMIRSGWGVPDSAFMKAFVTLYMPKARAAEVDSLVRVQALSAEAATAAALRRVIGDVDVTGILDKVTAPVLVLHARNDAIHPVEQGRLLARNLQNAEFHELDSPNHVPVPSDPVWATLVEETSRFLAQD